MTRKTSGIVGLACTGLLLFHTAGAADRAGRWTLSMDLGGNAPMDATLTEFDGPLGDGKMKIDPGFQMDMSAGLAILPWLEVGPELGFTFNGVDQIGDWSYPDTSLGQLFMMFNVRLEYPPEGRLAPFIGAGIGGAASFITFGDYYGYYYDYADGTGADITWAFQAFAGIRYRIGENWNLGLIYRYQATDHQKWDVDWWSGGSFDLGVKSIRMHSACILFSGNF